MANRNAPSTTTTDGSRTDPSPIGHLKWSASWCIAVCLLSLPVSLVAQVISGHAKPPTSVVDLRNRSAVVAHFRVQSVGNVQAEQHGNRVTPVRIVQLIVVSSVKGGHRPGDQLALRVVGGTVDHEGRLVSASDAAEPMRVNDEYVLFLTPARTIDRPVRSGEMYDLLDGRNGVIQVTTGEEPKAIRPSALSRTEELRSKPTMPLNELLNLLRGGGRSVTF